MGRSRALEVMLSAEDYDADLAERYGSINRAFGDGARDPAAQPQLNAGFEHGLR